MMSAPKPPLGSTTESQSAKHPSGNLKPLNAKPVAKAIHQVNQSATAKWVPINKSFITLAKIILCAAAERFGFVNLAITLRCISQQGYRHLILVNDEKDIQIAAVGRVEEFIISTEMPMTPASERLNSAEAITIPVDFQGQRLGYLLALVHNTKLELDPRSNELAQEQVEEAMRNLVVVADEIIGIIKRYQTRYRAIYVYGDQCYWIGNSPALRHLDHMIDQLAKSNLPVLVRGNKGSGKIIAARALHCERYDEIVPFIESACNEWQEGAAASILQALHIYAQGGTLFLRNIDKLSSGNFQALQQFWFVKSADSAQRGQTHQVHLIVSVSARDIVLESDVAQWLELQTVELYLPDLRERFEDLRDLSRFFMREYAGTKEFDLTEEAWQFMEAIDWQKNVDQLKQVIQKLAPRVDQPLVELPQLKAILAS